MAVIEVITFITVNSKEYAEFLRKTGELLKSGDHNIKWRFIRTGSKCPVPKNFELIKSIEISDTVRPAKAHSILLNEAINLSTEDYCILCDCDIALLYNNWDKVIIDELEEVDIFSVDFPDSKMNHRPQRVPTSRFFAFKKALLKKCKPDFSPGGKTIKISTPAESREYGYPVGHYVVLDTGYKLRELIAKYSLKHKTLKNELIPNELTKQIDTSIFSELEVGTPYKINHLHILWGYSGRPFCAHKHYSRKHPITEKDGPLFVHKVERYISENSLHSRTK